LFHILSRVQISGLGNVPAQGAYLIAINHVSLYEAPLVVAFWPTSPEIAGAADVWDRPGQAFLARAYGGIPIHREVYDRRVIDITLSVLRSGYPLLIAPEGGRSHQPGMRRAKPGVAYLMDKARVPVVPVGVVGSTNDFLRRALRAERPLIGMRVGPPLRLPPVKGRGKERRAALQENADIVMEHIAALLPADYRGVYA
jgi:1-acyl-sn-glycerol-3-phosphate acyltransferase